MSPRTRTEEFLAGTLAELKAGLAHIYGERLRGLYLFGSHARGDADEESDLDVMIVLDRFDRYAAEVDRTGALVSKLSIDSGISISRVFVSEGDWDAAGSPLIANARREAVPA